MKLIMHHRGFFTRYLIASALLLTCQNGPWIFSLVPEMKLEILWAGSGEPAAQMPPTTPGLTGHIRGSVRISSKIPSKSMAVSVYSRRASVSASGAAPVQASELENVVVYLEGLLPPRSPSPQQLKDAGVRETADPTPESGFPNPTMRQINETFVPHVLPILAGTSVDFPNSDPFFHNVFSLSGPRSFDLGRYPQGQKRTVRFTKPGMVKVFCHIHSNMSAVILVFDHPYFAMVDHQGQFLLPPVSPGSYTLVGWHERLKPVNYPVVVKAGETLVVDIVL